MVSEPATPLRLPSERVYSRGCHWSSPSDAATRRVRLSRRGCRAARQCRERRKLTRCGRADELRVRPGPDGVSVSIDPARAGWRYLAFRAVALGADERLDVGGTGSETA